MKITDEAGQAKPESGNATRFIWYKITYRYKPEMDPSLIDPERKEYYKQLNIGLNGLVKFCEQC